MNRLPVAGNWVAETKQYDPKRSPVIRLLRHLGVTKLVTSIFTATAFDILTLRELPRTVRGRIVRFNMALVLASIVVLLWIVDLSFNYLHKQQKRKRASLNPKN